MKDQIFAKGSPEETANSGFQQVIHLQMVDRMCQWSLG